MSLLSSRSSVRCVPKLYLLVQICRPFKSLPNKIWNLLRFNFSGSVLLNLFQTYADAGSLGPKIEIPGVFFFNSGHFKQREGPDPFDRESQRIFYLHPLGMILSPSHLIIWIQCVGESSSQSILKWRRWDDHQDEDRKDFAYGSDWCRVGPYWILLLFRGNSEP